MRIHDYLDYWAVRFPDEVYASDGEHAVTWGEMRDWSNQAARWLAGQIEPSGRFGILAKNSLEILVLYFAASRAGVVAVPLNTRLAPPEWAFILKDAGVGLVVAEEEFAAGVERIRGDLSVEWCAAAGTVPGWRSFEHEVSGHETAPFPRHADPADSLYQMYTSGTTGSPKGAVLTNEAVTANVTQWQTAIGLRRKRAMVVMPLFHCGAAVTAFTHTASGTSIRLVRDFRAAEAVEVLRREHIAMTALVPSMIQMLLAEPSAQAEPFPDLELIAYGASPIASELLREAIGVFRCGFVQAYGMTELGAVSTVLNPEDHVRALRGDAHLLLSAGRPTVGTEVRVVDEDDVDVARGQVGEIVVRGPQAMEGYWGRPDATAKALRGGWMHTGDAGYLDGEGYLYISDRVKDMIISGGENVYPREIEEAILKLPGVVDVAVVAVPDDRWGETPKAFIVAAHGATLTEDAVIAHCRTLLAGFKCPRAVAFVSSLPRNATGKVLKRVLREG